MLKRSSTPIYRTMIRAGMWLYVFAVGLAGVSAAGRGRQGRLLMLDTEPYASVPDLISSAGYPVERHRALTRDGYTLQLHRIPAGSRSARRTGGSAKGKRAVLLVHGLFGSSSDYVLLGPKRSLAFMLADSGYDVWLGNMRGTDYSSHISVSKNNTRLWEFSFAEHGKYDIPAIVDTVLAVTGLPKLLYIGHSMGTTSFFIMMDQSPQYNKKVVGFIGLAPAVFMDNLRPTANLLIDTMRWPQIMRSRNQNVINLSRAIRDLLFQSICSVRGDNICMRILYSVVGEDMEQNDWETVPLAIARSQPISLRQLEHFLKNAISGDFLPWGSGMFDTSMPAYNLSRTIVPTHIYYGENDILTEKSQVMRLAHALKIPNNTSGIHRVPWKKFNHLDFIYAKDLDRLLNYELVHRVNDMYKRYGS